MVKQHHATWPRLSGAFLIATVLACLIARPAAAEPDFADPRIYELAQTYMLQLINEERARHGAGSLRLDPVASQAAKLHAEDMLLNGYFSHWNMAGKKPTQRYNEQGGYHAVAENVYYDHGTHDLWEEMIEKEMQVLMDSDGHRRAILAPHNTHAGIGFAHKGRDFYGVQEFTCHFGGEYYCATSALVGESVQLAGRFDPGFYELAHILVGYEDRPKPRDRIWLQKTSSYQEADKIVAGYLADPEMKFKGMQTFHELQVDQAAGWFKCQALMDYKGKEGLYYLFVWLKDKRTGQQVHAATATVDVAK